MLNQNGTKTCPRCGDTKLAVGNFYKSGSSSDGFAGYCIFCTKEYATAWQKALPEDRRRAKNKADWQCVKQRVKNLSPEKRIERSKRRAALAAKWVNKSPENKAKQAAWQRAYKARDPERNRQRNRIHNNRQRAKKLGRGDTFQFYDWVCLLEKYEHTCAFCGATQCLLDIEHLDSFHDGGHNIPGNIVPACRPCNAQKWRKSLSKFCKERGLDESSIRQRASPS